MAGILLYTAAPDSEGTLGRARSGGICLALWATPPRSSVDAPFVELHERQSTDVFAMS